MHKLATDVDHAWVHMGASVCVQRHEIEMIVHLSHQGRRSRDHMVVGCMTIDYLCNQCISPLTFSVRTPLRRGVLDTTASTRPILVRAVYLQLL